MPDRFLVMLGPFGPYGHGSVIPAIEVITRYIEKVVKKMQFEDVKSFEPKQEAVDDFKQYRELFLKRTVWDSPCRSWFKGGKIDGPIMMWPGNRLHFFKVLENPRWEVRQTRREVLIGANICRTTIGNMILETDSGTGAMVLPQPMLVNRDLTFPGTLTLFRKRMGGHIICPWGQSIYRAVIEQTIHSSSNVSYYWTNSHVFSQDASEPAVDITGSVGHRRGTDPGSNRPLLLLAPSVLDICWLYYGVYQRF